MMKRILLTSCALAALTLLGVGNASAAYTTFFGEDLNNSAATPLAAIPNSAAAQTAFLANLSGVGIENFEAFDAGTKAPLVLNFAGFGGGTLQATLSGGDGAVASNAVGATNGVGRYSVPGGTKFWEVSAGGGGNFAVAFDQEIAAFGFYGIDIGDFGGQLSLGFYDDTDTVINTLVVTNTIGNNGSTDGSVLYFGAIAGSASDLFKTIRFNTTTGGGDFFAFDSFTIAEQGQVCGANCPTVPEPGSLALAGLALAGLGLSRRKTRA